MTVIYGSCVERQASWYSALVRRCRPLLLRYRALLWRCRALLLIYKAVLWRCSVVFRDIGQFCTDVGLFCWDIGLFGEDVGPFCGDVGLFCRDIRLFCRDVGLFCGDVGLFWGDTELFCGDKDIIRNMEGSAWKTRILLYLRESGQGSPRISHWKSKLRVVPPKLIYPPENLSFEFSTNSGLQISFWRKSHIRKYPVPIL